MQTQTPSNGLSPHRRAFIEQLFVALEMLDYLTSEPKEPKEYLLHAEMYTLMTQPFSLSEKDRGMAIEYLATHKKKRDDFFSILKRVGPPQNREDAQWVALLIEELRSLD